MPFSLAFAISLALHAAWLAPPWWRPTRIPSSPRPELEVRLVEPLPLMEQLATKPPTLEPAPLPTPSPSRQPKAAPSRRAQAALTEHLFYPAEAVAAGLEGETILLLVLDARGDIEHIDIVRSSGHALLDQAALAAARKIGKLPGSPRQTLLPVNFRLQ